MSASTPPLNAPQWFACHTRSRHEKKVHRILMERGIEAFLPLAKRTSQWMDRKKAVEFVRLPGYTFARFAPQVLSQVHSVPGLVEIVRFRRPSPSSRR